MIPQDLKDKIKSVSEKIQAEYDKLEMIVKSTHDSININDNEFIECGFGLSLDSLRESKEQFKNIIQHLIK